MNKKLFFKQFFSAVYSLILYTACYSPLSYADTGITITEGKKDKIKVYSGPSSAEKMDDTITKSEIAGLSVIEDAMNGRFLKINVNGKDQWIKARQVITSRVYDVGACEKQNKSTGTRAAVNCTE